MPDNEWDDEERRRALIANHPEEAQADKTTIAPAISAELPQEVSESELGQLHSDDTPGSQGKQGWSRSQGQSRGGELPRGDSRQQEGDVSKQPELTFAGPEKDGPTGATRESAIHLTQNELSSILKYETDAQMQSKEGEPKKTPVDRHHKRQEQEASQEIKKEQEKDTGNER